MGVVSVYASGERKTQSLYLIRCETESGEMRVLEQAYSAEDAVKQVKLPAPFALIECVKAFIVKAQRPVVLAAKEPKLLVYSEDGQIAPTMVSVNSDLGIAMGEKLKAHFVCTINDGSFTVHREVNENTRRSQK